MKTALLSASAFLVLMGCSSPVPKTPKTVLVLGDSLTEGKGVKPSQAWPALIQDKSDTEGAKLTIINAGISGDTTDGGLRRLPKLLEENPTVDIFILALGANDILRRQSMKQMEENLNAILSKVRDAHPEVKFIVAGVEFGLVLGLLGPKNLDEKFGRVAEKNGAVFVPNLIKGVVGKPQYNVSDNIHPNPDGHKIIADRMWKSLFR